MRAPRKKIAIVGVALALLLAGLAALLIKTRTGSDARLAQRDPAHRVVRAAVLRSEEPLAPGEARPAAWLLEPGAPARRISGVVLDDGRPFPGAIVHLRSEVFMSQGLDGPARTTDDAGRFDFGEQLPSDYVVVASAAGYEPRRVRVNLRDPDGPPPAAELVVEISECEQWSFGTVRDVRGRPLAGATVSLTAKLERRSWFAAMHEVRTEVDGRFRICRPSGRMMLWVGAEGYATVHLRGNMPTEGWDVVLLPEAKIEGIVLDPTSKPVEGARVVALPTIRFNSAFSGPYALTAFSGSDGTFVVGGLLPGTYEVAADHWHYLTNAQWPTVTVEAGHDARDVVVEMGFACRLLAGVVLREGSPLAGVYVGDFYEAVTQEDGTFVIPCGPLERFEFKVDKHDVSNPTVPAGDEDIDDLVFEVSARAEVSGRVTATGTPVANALVGVGDPSEFANLPVLFGNRYRTTTDETGHYRLVGLRPGTHEINAWDPKTKQRSEPALVQVTERRAVTGFDLELSHAGTVSGIVVDPEGRAVAGVLIHLIGGTAPKTYSASRSDVTPFDDTTNDRGEFEIRGLAAGSYVLCLGWCSRGEADKRYLPVDGDEWPPVVVTRNDDDVQLRLVVRSRMGLSISGRVVYGDTGAPCPLAAVSTGGRDAHAVTDARGKFTLSNLPEGNYTIRASAQDGSSGSAKDVAAGATEVKLSIERSATLSGTIAGGDGECSVEAAQVLRESDDWEAMFTAVQSRYAATSVREFEFSGIAPGEYRVQAVCVDGVASSVVVVLPGETASITMHAGGGGEVRGVAELFPGGTPAGSLDCSLSGVSARTEPDGTFHFAQVPTGPGDIYCGRWGSDVSVTGSTSVEVQAEETTNIEVFVIEEPPRRSRRNVGILGAKIVETAAEGLPALGFTEVIADGPAARAGIHSGDVLLNVDGGDSRGPRMDAARRYLTSRSPGTTLSLSVRRGAETATLSVTVGTVDHPK